MLGFFKPELDPVFSYKIQFMIKFVAELSALFDKVKVGLPWDESTQLGSLIYEAQVKKVLSYVELAKEEGARVVAGGERITDGELGKGCFVRPTLIVDATNDMRVAREEIFGPVAVVIKFHSEDEVIEQANDSLYGLGGGVFTQTLTAPYPCSSSNRNRSYVG